jgi:phenylacetic acid degradation operon negative regulatory protein
MTAIEPDEAFRLYLPLLTEWRRLPYRDPGLPLALLPDGWKGEEATALFHRLNAVLRPLAQIHARAVVSAPARAR